MEANNERNMTAEDVVAEEVVGTTDAAEENVATARENRKNKGDSAIIDELGIISHNTRITGDVITKGHLAIYGNVQGNIVANGNVVISGEVAGDIKCNNLKLSNCSIVANSTVRNNVVIEENSTIQGKIVCGKISVDGTVNGDIDANESIDIFKNATVIGNLKTKGLAVESGAQLQGNISMDK